MPSDEYSKALNSIVIACADCIILDQKGKMLLGRRAIEPWPDWWIIGGRMRPGESFEQAAVRNVKREVNLDISSSRFQYFDTCSLVFARRMQPPEDHGVHAVSITMILEISNKEVEQIHPNEEYEKVGWFDPYLVAAGGEFHPALRRYAELLIQARRG
jgi:ADP-ribose pyrophosphatase YjhB (NUDIX family)